MSHFQIFYDNRGRGGRQLSNLADNGVVEGLDPSRGRGVQKKLTLSDKHGGGVGREVGWGGHSGPPHLHNFSKLKKLTQAPSHLGRSSQHQKSGKVRKLTLWCCRCGCVKIKFDPILTLK